MLASFYAVGVCLIGRIQNMENVGNKSGIKDFLFGKAASIGADDVTLMGVVTALVVLIVLFFTRRCWSPALIQASRAPGFPVGIIHYALMLLLSFSVVIALQAVGVVLVSAMLITPAAGYLLTDRMHRMLGLAMLFGVFAGALGILLIWAQTCPPAR